jgi:hypothetical protein
VMDINESFMRNASRNVELVCFFETMPMRIPTYKGKEVVSRSSDDESILIIMVCTDCPGSIGKDPREWGSQYSDGMYSY